MPVDIHILIVDDQGTMRSIVRQLLQQEGFRNISEAENGEDAFRAMAELAGSPPDLIICDLHMDKMDGMAFVNCLRRGKDNTPVLILTGEKDGLVLDVTRQVGATKVLNKPISAPELAEEVRRAIGFKEDQSSL